MESEDGLPVGRRPRRSIFGEVAVLLAAAGIYGVMSFAVSQRTPGLASEWRSAPPGAAS